MQTQQNSSKGASARRGLDEGAREMVGREVHYCVSSLISELAGDEKHSDELMPVLAGPQEWEEPAEWHINKKMHRQDCVEYLENLSIECRDSDSVAVLREAVLQNANDEGIQEFCEARGVEPREWEIYEHWIVSDWLADKLEKKGHAIVRDFYGLTIWGRPTTGQAIYCDSVIQGIYAEMMAAH